MPKVSVIIPNYNYEKYLSQRIETVLAQTYKDYEIIILDDCSTDKSSEIIELYRSNPKVKQIIYNAKNSGSPFAQWEKGILTANGHWLWIAESDDYANPEFLNNLVSIAEENDNIGIAFCASYWIDANSKEGIDLSLYKESFFRKGITEIKTRMSKQCTIQNVSSAIIRKDVALKAITGLEKYKACGDWIFYIRILHDANLVFTDKKLNYFRWYHNNISHSANKSGQWILEGINIFDNINYKKIAFSVEEFFSVFRWWFANIRNSDIEGKNKLRKLMLRTFFRYLLATK